MPEKKYDPKIQQCLANFRAAMKEECGWISETASEKHPYPVVNNTADPWLVRQMARSNDPWNPLWSDEQYAKNTRWGGIVAAPLFVRTVTHGGAAWVSMESVENLEMSSKFLGISWEFYRHVRMGDSFRAWRARPEATDVTTEGGPITFKINAHDVTIYNQNNEKVARYVRWFSNSFYLNGEKPEPQHAFSTAPGEYCYTDEQRRQMDALEKGETIRGAVPRYWEDVQEGDELTPVILGPLTEWDLMVHLMAMPVEFYPMRKYVEDGTDGVPDKDTNYYSHHLCCHLADRFHKQSGRADKAALVSCAGESFLARLVTNWMGDDAFMTKFSWNMLGLTLRGDALAAGGKVVRKYCENGQYLVDLELWDDSLIDGKRMHSGTATVRLPSAADPDASFDY